MPQAVSNLGQESTLWIVSCFDPNVHINYIRSMFSSKTTNFGPNKCIIN